MEYIYEYFLEIVEYKFARNGLTNWKTFLTNILKNIILHLLAVNPIKLWKSLYPNVQSWEVTHIGQIRVNLTFYLSNTICGVVDSSTN